jgi:subfamily B ATP-binding cassette protein MsbA
MKPLIDEMFVNKNQSMLLMIPIGIIVIYLTKSIGRYIQSIYMNYIGQHIIKRFRSELLNKILNMDMAFLYKNKSGNLISRITNDIERIKYFVSNMLPELIREIITSFALLIYLIYLDKTLTFIILIIIPIAIIPISSLVRKLKKYSKLTQEKNADILSRLTEIFNNNEIIKANNTNTYELKKFNDENESYFKINMKSIYIGDLSSPIMELIAAVAIAFIIYIGGREVYNNTLTVGEFTAFLTAVGLITQPLKKIGSIISKIPDAIIASERIFLILDIQNKIKFGTKTLDKINSIEYKNFSFKYDDINILNNINLKIQTNQNIALIGNSGGGKTTLINMLLRFYDATTGEILINGCKIENFKEDELKKQISIVSQNIYIFQDTIKENIIYGQPFSQKKLDDAIRLSKSDFIFQLENGVDTILEEKGSNLSGGQKQRISIARAIYKNASLLLLDEATSALDNQTESEIKKAIFDNFRDKIIITIAHRLSTIQEADEIVIIKDGTILNIGTHLDLIKNSEEYNKMLYGEIN